MLFEKAVALIKRYGYRIYGFKKDGYAFFTDGKNIGHFQTNEFGYLNFGTVHRPNRIAGTGYRVATGITSVDEITEEEDCDALLNAGWCGVDLLATAHAADREDLFHRPVYRPIIDSHLFDTLVIMQPDKSWRAERM